MNRFVYTILLWLVLPFTPIKLLWRARKQPEYLHHWQERYGFYIQPPLLAAQRKPIIWLHCVSVGETMAAAPLIEALLRDYPTHQILLTHTTPTGRATSERLFGQRVIRAYLPFDVPFAVNRFMQHFSPTIGLLVETELWFNLIASTKARNTPLLLINARLSEKSARGYHKLGALISEGLAGLTCIAAQTAIDAERFDALCHRLMVRPMIHVVGNIKFDVMPPNDALNNAQKLRTSLLNTSALNHRLIFLAASTREKDGIAEENLVLDAVHMLRALKPLTILVPRHPERFRAVEAILQKRGLNYAKRSTLENLSITQIAALDVLLGDSMGELFTYYGSCDIAFIGGSLLNLGGQNLIEACAMGKPTLIGPSTYNFTQVVNLAINAGATQQVQDVESLARTLDTLLQAPEQQRQMALQALTFSQQNQGATQRVLDRIKPYIRAT